MDDGPAVDDPDPGVDGPARIDGARGTTAGALVALGLVVLGLLIGLGPLSDNSFFTHLSTGRIILDERSVPTSDPYSFTAHGEPWTVQSWLASVVYAVAEEIGGFTAIRIVVAALVVAVLLGVWRLTRPAGGLIARILTVSFVAVIAASYWTERPLLFGLLGLVLVLMAAGGDLDPRWLVPVMWVWANSHGSFPFAPAVLVLLVIGRHLDGERPGPELRALGWSSVGLLVACVNPLGPRLLAFPAAMLGRREAFGYVTEWGPIDLGTTTGLIFVLQVLVAAAAIITRTRSWRLALPLAAFAVAAALSRRNIIQASVVVAFVTAPALAGFGRLGSDMRRPIFGPAAMFLALVAAIVGFAGVTGPNADLGLYPVGVLEEADRRDLLGPDSRLLTTDFAGGYSHARFGPDGVRVFVDDRVDMYPLPVVRDLVTLTRGGTDEELTDVLDRRDPTVIAWQEDSDVGRLISSSDRWEVVARDDGWLLALPTQ